MFTTAVSLSNSCWANLFRGWRFGSIFSWDFLPRWFWRFCWDAEFDSALFLHWNRIFSDYYRYFTFGDLHFFCDAFGHYQPRPCEGNRNFYFHLDVFSALYMMGFFWSLCSSLQIIRLKELWQHLQASIRLDYHVFSYFFSLISQQCWVTRVQYFEEYSDRAAAWEFRCWFSWFGQRFHLYFRW